jgi:glutamate dehydrogenase (NAD(P)+)
MGAKVVAIHDHTGAVLNARGIDITALKRHSDATNRLGGFSGGEEVSPELFWGADCDVMVPAAIENQITAKTAPLVRAKVVVEGANGPTTTIAERELTRRGIEIVPDILANSGGVIASFFEWLQNRASQYWSLEEVDRKLKDMILAAYGHIVQVAKERKLDMRVGAYAVAINRLADAYRNRGIFP